jgi:hypothetical protein
MSSEVLQRIKERSRATAAKGVWGFLAPVINVRNLPFADSVVINELREEFSSEQLEAARVLVRRRDNQLELNSVLVGEATQGLFLRQAKDQAPFDIVNHKGSLTADNPPAFDCGRDFFTKRFSGRTKSIFVAFSDEDLATLRILRLPCTPAAGLATMHGEQLRRLFENAPGFPDNASTQAQGQSVSIASGSYRLVMTAWEVAEMNNERPGGVASIVELLLKAEDLFGFDTSGRVGVWQPTAREFNRIRSAAEFQDRALVCNLIWKSVSHSTVSARHWHEETVGNNAAGYDAARRELLWTIGRARQLGFQSSEVAKRLEEFNRSFNKNVVDVIIHDAMSASDSVDRALLLAASELMGHWHKSSSLVRSTQDGVSGRYHPQEDSFDPEELKDRLRVVDGLVKIHRELYRNK